MSKDSTAEIQKHYLIQTYSPSRTIVRGSMSWVWDDKGGKYLDFSTGISVCNLGHCHPVVTEAIQRQAAKLVHVSNLFYNENQPLLARRLAELGLGGKAFFCNSGAEANEGIIKLARRWGNESGKDKIICMENSFHGRTLATLAATGQAKYRAGFQPDTPGFKHIPFNSIDAVEKSIDKTVAAILLEPIQGEGGIIPADPEYLKTVREICDKNNILLLFDEVQSGMGRTGELFAWRHYGVEPDGFTLAKALGNGFPIGAILIRKNLGEVLAPGSHASTFGGNPLACAASLAVLEAIEQENVLDNCKSMAGQLWSGLEKLRTKHSVIRELRGIGLMIGLDLDIPAKTVVKAAAENGLLTLSAGEKTLRLLPPLTVDQNEINIALERLDKALNAAVTQDTE